MRIVVALGGNALLRRGEELDADSQRRNLGRAAAALAEIARKHDLIVTHGNGPQVGLLALQSAAYGRTPPYPLDVLGAESEGMIGYLIEQELANLLPDRRIATLITRTEVDRQDRAFRHPTKPIGPVYDKAEAERLGRERGWAVAQDGRGYRRLVPSPEPRRILEIGTIKLLVDNGVIVICSGGGGVPVVLSEWGGIHGVEAVIDKDLSAALLAIEIGADMLLILTDVSAVFTHWDSPQAKALRACIPAELRNMTFAAGSMAPKVEAACRFVEKTGSSAAIGSLDDVVGIPKGEAGTLVYPG
jgi:carbamate kinase